MHHGLRKISSLFLSAALAAPLALMAASQDRDDRRDNDRDKRADNSRRYYDKKHKDYHQWNDNEGRAYQRYQAEHHEKREFARLNSRDQANYWNWRHEHPDNDRR